MEEGESVYEKVRLSKKVRIALYTGGLVLLLGGSWIGLNWKSIFLKPNFTGEEKIKQVILISLDAVYEADFETLSQMPVFKELIERGAYSKQVKAVYPTLTYPVHTSIITGAYPDKHGIYHNHPLQPGITSNNQVWFWYQDEINVPTLFAKLEEHNLVTASILWPVTGGANITYNLPEVVALEGENQAIKLLKAGTPLYLIEEYFKNGRILGDGQQPRLDQFSTAVAVDTIKTKKPNFLAIHLIAVDHFRHKTGVQSEAVDQAFKVYEKSVTDIVNATKEAGTYDDTIFVITSDHGQIDINQNVYLNNVLERAGYISRTENGIEYQAYAQSLGLGTYIYIKDHDPLIKKEVMKLLKTLMKNPKYGIERIYDESELSKMHASSKFDLAIEAKSGYQFKDNLTTYDTKSNIVYGNHGYSPSKTGYKNIFIISGNSIKNKYDIGPMNIVDIAPTISELFGFEYYDCDGEALEEIYD